MTEKRDNRSKITGAAATLLYLFMWLLLMLFITFDNNREDQLTDGGILLNFGEGDTGSGAEDLPNDDNSAAVQPSRSSSPDTPVLTQNTMDAPTVRDNPQTTTTRSRQANTTQNDQTPATQPAETPREANPRALFPGRSASSSTSEGENGGAGNQGNPAGSPDGSHSGTGMGGDGKSYELGDRRVLNSLPNPSYSSKEEGRVVVEIYVDQRGNVTNAIYRSKGSTTNSSVLVNAAIEAAKKAKFNVDHNAKSTQIGTITYNFKINAN